MYASVVILCGVDSFLQTFMLAAHDEDMTNGDYVYIITDLLPSSNNLAKRWMPTSGSDVATAARTRLAFQPVLQVNRVLQKG